MPRPSSTAASLRVRTPSLEPPALYLRPEWIRPGDVPHVFGVSRSKLYEWLDKFPEKLKTKAIGERGSKRPIRLISYDHLSRFIENLPDVSDEKKKRAA